MGATCALEGKREVEDEVADGNAQGKFAALASRANQITPAAFCWGASEPAFRARRADRRSLRARRSFFAEARTKRWLR